MYVEVLFVTIINNFTVGNPSPPSTEGGQAAPAGSVSGWKTQKSDWILRRVPTLAVTPPPGPSHGQQSASPGPQHDSL